MSEETPHPPVENTIPLRVEPRWPVVVALLVTAALYGQLPERLTVGPRWLLPTVIVLISIFAMITHRSGNQRLNTILGFFLEGCITIFLMWSVARLIASLPSREIDPRRLLLSAAILWLCNIALFALWYWRLDAGGPYARHGRGHHRKGAFLFPQMTNDGSQATPQPWAPRFVDYLFLAFNTSTALSPTDAPILSRWAKLLVMLQAIISLTIIVLLAARAVNVM